MLNSTCVFRKDCLFKDGINSGVIRKKLSDRRLCEGDSTIGNCVKIWKARELAELQLKTLNEDKIKRAIL